MKQLGFLICPIILMSSLTASAQFMAETTHSPSKVRVRVSKVYSPEGFDDNDNVQVVGAGLFSDTCYRYADTTVTVNEANKSIRLNPVAYKYNGVCLQVLLPFEAPVTIGVLKPGLYTIYQADQSKPLGVLNIRPSVTGNPDDFSYAPVSQAFFQSKNGFNSISISGTFPLSCMKLKEIRISVQSDSLVVLPITDMASGPCTQGRFDFESATAVGPVKPGRYLLHVRSMNGKSINNLVDVH